MSANQYFGNGVNTCKIFDLEETDSNGKRKCCTGEKSAPYHKWYGIKGFGQSGIVFCEFCAENSITKDKTYELTDVYDKSLFRCNTIYTKKCLKVNIDNRVKQYNGLIFNVNIINKEDNDFTPATKPSSYKMDDNELYVQMPTGSYYEISLKSNTEHQWGRNMCFKIEKGWLGDGREVIYRSENGGEVYCDLSSLDGKLPQIRVNSTKSGSLGKRFMFYAPSSQDPFVDHINKSNEINFKIGIYREEKPRLAPAPPPSKSRTPSAPQTRGSSGVTLEAQGISKPPSTYDTKSKFVYLYNFDIKIILLNFEPEVEKLEKTFLIQNQIKTNPKIERLQESLDSLKLDMGVLQNMMKKMEHKTNNIEREIESLK